MTTIFTLVIVIALFLGGAVLVNLISKNVGGE